MAEKIIFYVLCDPFSPTMRIKKGFVLLSGLSNLMTKFTNVLLCSKASNEHGQFWRVFLFSSGFCKTVTQFLSFNLIHSGFLSAYFDDISINIC